MCIEGVPMLNPAREESDQQASNELHYFSKESES